jgi:hypothetical protein
MEVFIFLCGVFLGLFVGVVFSVAGSLLAYVIYGVAGDYLVKLTIFIFVAGLMVGAFLGVIFLFDRQPEKAGD